MYNIRIRGGGRVAIYAKNALKVDVEILKASNLSNSNLEIGWILIKNSKEADLAVACTPPSEDIESFMEDLESSVLEVRLNSKAEIFI